MALTLPYPGLTFVPLDVLTAEEQNEIVANYTYIANQFPIAASNIDFSTVKNTDMPIAHENEITLGWGLKGTLIRIGNTVMLTSNSTTSQMGAYDQTLLGETIPSGFRPTAEGAIGSEIGVVHIPFVSTAGVNTVGGWGITSDGKIYLSNHTSVSSNTRIMGSGCWVTEDDWPS